MPDGLSQLELMPWLIALVVLGMPHGAMDWLIIRKIDREQGRSNSLSVLMQYIIMMIAGALLLAFVPVMACVLFLVLTAIHWGAADLHAYAPVQSSRDKGAWWMLAIARGGLIVATPFALQPQTAWQPFAALSGGSSIVNPMDLSRACLSLLTVSGLMLAYGCFSGRVHRPSRFMAESVGVVAVLALLPPMLAIGCYFLLVHAPRHCIRLHRRRDIIQTGYIREALPRIIAAHVASWPFLIPAILVVLAWAAFLGFSAWSVVVASIGFYTIATLPHHMLGMRVLDRPNMQSHTLSPPGLYTTSTG